MSTIESSIGHLTAEAAVSSARELAPRFAERAARAEELRRLPDETVRELLDSGLLRLTQPARFGGPELGLDAHMEVAIEISRACGSTGWTFSVLASHFWLLSMFSDEVQHEVWGADPSTLLSTGTTFIGPPARVVDGGYAISGCRWPFSSGVDFAQWAMLGILVLPATEGGQPDFRFMVVPRRDFEIVDDWHVAGMRGTGSKSVAVREAFVPAHRSVSAQLLLDGRGPGAAVNANPMYTIPLIAAWPIFLSSPLVGIALGALEAFRDRTKTKLMAYTGASTAQQQTIQVKLAEAFALVDAARTLLTRDMGEVMGSRRPSEELSLLVRARNRRDFAFATRLAVQSVNVLFEVAGASALYDDSALQRAWRDVNAASHHGILVWDTSGGHYGRTELGLPPQDPYV